MSFSQEFIDTYRQLLSVEERKLDAQLQGIFNANTAQLVRNGNLNSGTALTLMATSACATVPIRAQTALNLLLRCADSYRITVDRAGAAEALSILDAELRGDVARLTGFVQETAPFRGTAARHEGAVEAALGKIDSDMGLELERIAGELNLIASAAEAPSGGRGVSAMTFNGPVGLVQTGPGSYGVAHVNIDAVGREQLAAALTAVATAIQAHQQDLPFNATEVTEMVTVAQQEIAKPKPNGALVRSIIQAVGSAISFAPKIRPAYETLKWAAKFVGVALP